LGLSGRLDFETIQVVVGGRRDTGSYLELVVKGTPAKTSTILRTAADMSGGFIAAARHPLPAGYIKKHAAIGGVSMAIELGKAILVAEPKGAEAVMEAICEKTRGEIIGRGVVAHSTVAYSGAFDIGKVYVDAPGGRFTLHVMNEYMAVDDPGGNRVATYPDVITTLSAETGQPVSVGHLKEGMEVAIFHIHKRHIPISSGVLDASVYPEVEQALGINIADYALAK